MYKNLIILFTCFLLIFSCTAPWNGSLPAEKGFLVIPLPGCSRAIPTQADVAYYDVQVVSTGLGYDTTLRGIPGETLVFEDLYPGEYDVEVRAYNSQDLLIFTGSALTVPVTAGVATVVQIQMEYTTGEMVIEISFPESTVQQEWLGFESDFLDLDTGTAFRDLMELMPFPGEADGWDIKVAYNSNWAVHSVIFQNQSAGVQIAHLENRIFSTVTAADAAGAVFTASLIDVSFDANRVILIQTDLGAVFKLGNAAEDNTGLFFDYQLLME